MQPPTPDRPIISFLTDFGLDGAAATCRGVMLGICRDAQIIDLAHTIRKYAIRDGAFILEAALPYLPIGVCVAVVDPGVGTERRAIALLTRRGDILVGPDNGLLPPAAEALGGIVAARALSDRRHWLSSTASTTFHGRDIFSPVAARLAAGSAEFTALGDEIAAADLVRLPALRPRVSDGTLETVITYIDSFGNLRLAGGAPDLVAAFGEVGGRRFAATIDGNGATVSESMPFADTFGVVPLGSPLLYVDSLGNLAIADNQGSFAGRHAVEPGARIRIGPA